MSLLIHTWLQPGDVEDSIRIGNRLNGFPQSVSAQIAWLKPGENEKGRLFILYDFPGDTSHEGDLERMSGGLVKEKSLKSQV